MGCPESLWIIGSAKSGKTATLIAQLKAWREAAKTLRTVSVGSNSATPLRLNPKTNPDLSRATLVFAANADNRAGLMQRIAQQQVGQETLLSTTPLAFFESEVLLFWPLIIQQRNLRGYFPYRLRPEAEQSLSLRLWGKTAIAMLQDFEAGSTDQWGRRILDLIQLAASSGTPLNNLAVKLRTGDEFFQVPESIARLIQELALQWQDWCLHRGILTYGLITDLYAQGLLTHDTYLQQISQRFSAIAADDVDNYPAIARTLFERFLDLNLPGIFTYSTTGGIRKGLGADPEAFLDLRERCTVLTLPNVFNLSSSAGQSYTDADGRSGLGIALPEEALTIYALQTASRTQLLQRVAQHVTQSIQEGSIQPQEIALIGPGLDPLARYALIDSLQRSGIPVEPLREQRSLQSSALVRALLTLLALVYPGLGHWVEAEQVAEMLVVLTRSSGPAAQEDTAIDPVRAGLFADYCFRPHPEQPELLPMDAYLRWDRLGYRAAQAYEQIRQWIAQQQGALQGHSSQSSFPPSPPTLPLTSYLTLSPVFVLDRAIQTFLMHHTLPIEQLAALRELMETAQHYWDVDARLRKNETDWPTVSEAIAHFIQLLRRGVITANPYPVSNQQRRAAVVLATSFQYLNARLQHSWQYWLDAGSQLWQYGGEVELWGASLFLTSPSSREAAQAEQPDARDSDSAALKTQQPALSQSRMTATLAELVSRTQSRIYLCHSDLAVNGQAQMGPLLPWVETAIPDSLNS